MAYPDTSACPRSDSRLWSQPSHPSAPNSNSRGGAYPIRTCLFGPPYANDFSQRRCSRIHQWCHTIPSVNNQKRPTAHAQFRGIRSRPPPKTPTAQPHAESDAVSALHRFHKAQVIKALKQKHRAINSGSLYPPFDPTTVIKSTTLHLDYTGAWPERGSMGTSHLEISTWESYIHINPLTGLKGAQTSESLTKTLSFFRDKGVVIDSLRVDNQSSPEFRAAARSVHIISDLVSANQKEPNRAERAIQTAKHHILASWAGFHRDCSHTFLDKCLPQIEITYVEYVASL